MKVVILAGGWGTRLGTLTEVIPKPMVKIGNHPILWHIMKIYSHYGFNEFIICLGVKGDIIKDYFYHYSVLQNNFTINLKDRNIEFYDTPHEDWKITLIDTGLNTLKGARIKRIEKYLDDENNLLTYGDGLADIDILELIKFHESHSKILTVTGAHTSARFGEIRENKGKILSFSEKPIKSSRWINGGYMVFNKEFLDYLTPDEDCDLEFGVIEELTEKEEVMMYKHRGNWECMDHERDVVYLNELWNTNKAFWKVWD